MISNWDTYASSGPGIEFSKHWTCLPHPTKLSCCSENIQERQVERMPERSLKIYYPCLQNVCICSFSRKMHFYSVLIIGILPDYEFLSSRIMSLDERQGMWITKFLEQEGHFVHPVTHSRPFSRGSQCPGARLAKTVFCSPPQTYSTDVSLTGHHDRCQGPLYS